jgi:hypothetical protein
LIFIFLNVLLICLVSEAAPKKVLTGEELKLYDAWVKTKDGTQYGFGISSAEDVGWLFKLIVSQFAVWIVLLGMKIIDWSKGDKDTVRRDLREVKEAILRLESHSKHWVTDKEVGEKVREEIKYLKSHGGKI